MIDLHIHLDGSLSPEFIIEQAKKNNSVLPANTPSTLFPYLTVSNSCPDLNNYLTKFQFPLSILQTEDALESAVYDLFKQLNKQNISYAEVRFAPQLHTQKGLCQEAITEATLSGLSSAISEFPIKGKLILCCMRGNNNMRENFKTLEIAQSYLAKGVAALDLAGAESLYPTSQYHELFCQAAKMDIPFTIHAGEAAGPESIKAALNFGASRIGHGIRCIEDPILIETLIDKKIPLEICPTSNLQTKACTCIETHPILKLLELGVCVTVNTDNITVSNTSLNQEFELLRSQLHMTPEQEKILKSNAYKARF